MNERQEKKKKERKGGEQRCMKLEETERIIIAAKVDARRDDIAAESVYNNAFLLLYINE